MPHAIAVLVHTPAHRGLSPTLTYASEASLAAGTLVRVPLGSRQTLGVVWDDKASAAPGALKAIAAQLSALPPLNAPWRDLVRFAAAYYQRSPGEIALSALPPQLRELDDVQLEQRFKKLRTATIDIGASQQTSNPLPEALSPTISNAPKRSPTHAPGISPELTPEQATALQLMAGHPGPYLLFGATGSGKTEVYMRRAADVLAADPLAQVLVMVPEINLTPQLQSRFEARFVPMLGESSVVSMHSGMTPAQRLKSWLAAHLGQARIVLGTRMAVFASLPHLRLIVVDEEHDASYKQQEGARYSARDLGVYRGKLEGIPVILGSATPSLESWHHSRPDGGRYLRIHMPSRVGQASLQPLVRRVDMNHQPKKAVLAPPLVEAIKARIAQGEQVMLLLNRRGYAPVLACQECDWKSECPHCSAYRVFHKIDRSLRCHHCGLAQAVPRSCPSCGNPDIAPLGRGTERLEEHVAELLADVRLRDGSPVRIARIDADSTRLKGELQSQLAQVHAGEVDVLVGTQMIAKGHDFRRISLVAAINPDGALFSSDFRAPERLFALLMQSAGRAGRDAQLSARSEMWVQTFHPAHPLFAALKQHDYPGFAQAQLTERAQAGLPPFYFQALVRSDARTQPAAQAFLQAAHNAGAELAQGLGVTLYPPVPLTIQRVANIERAQMLIESPSRSALQKFLHAWQTMLHETRTQEGTGVIRWAIDVDPLSI